MFTLTGKTCAVTGAATGIGREICDCFLRQGASKVYLLDRDGELGASTAKELGPQAVFVQCDVGDEASVNAAFEEIKNGGPLHVLVNNAGISAVGSLLNCSTEDFDRVYGVNIKGYFLVSKAAVGLMVAKDEGGVVLNIASCASLHPIQDRLAYATSKGAVITMTQSIATDYLKHGIRCNAICPGRVATPFVEGFLKKHYSANYDEMKQRLSEYMPLGRMAEPREVAKMCVYLASDDANYVTGASFAIDGGLVGADHPKIYDQKVVTHPTLRPKL